MPGIGWRVDVSTWTKKARSKEFGRDLPLKVGYLGSFRVSRLTIPCISSGLENLHDATSGPLAFQECACFCFHGPRGIGMEIPDVEDSAVRTPDCVSLVQTPTRCTVPCIFVKGMYEHLVSDKKLGQRLTTSGGTKRKSGAVIH